MRTPSISVSRWRGGLRLDGRFPAQRASRHQSRRRDWPCVSSCQGGNTAHTASRSSTRWSHPANKMISELERDLGRRERGDMAHTRLGRSDRSVPEQVLETVRRRAYASAAPFPPPAVRIRSASSPGPRAKVRTTLHRSVSLRGIPAPRVEWAPRSRHLRRYLPAYAPPSPGRTSVRLRRQARQRRRLETGSVERRQARPLERTAPDPPSHYVDGEHVADGGARRCERSGRRRQHVVARVRNQQLGSPAPRWTGSAARSFAKPDGSPRVPEPDPRPERNPSTLDSRPHQQREADEERVSRHAGDDPTPPPSYLRKRKTETARTRRTSPRAAYPP